MVKISRIVSLLFVLPLFFISAKVRAQSPFYDEIRHFKSLDSTQFPPDHAILFVGSSSIRKWIDVQSYFPDKTVINRGFGGSELSDLIRYLNMIIIPYHPRQIVIYAGENDLAYSDTVTPQIVLSRFITLFDMIRKALPGEPIIFISIKPSPSRERLMPEMVDANNLIRKFLSTKRNAVFVDVYHKMLTREGRPMPDIFLDDKLHMNAKGYHIWQKQLQPYLLKNP
jgi:lysophospholipase L1-like esterase